MSNFRLNLPKPTLSRHSVNLPLHSAEGRDEPSTSPRALSQERQTAIRTRAAVTSKFLRHAPNPIGSASSATIEKPIGTDETKASWAIEREKLIDEAIASILDGKTVPKYNGYDLHVITDSRGRPVAHASFGKRPDGKLFVRQLVLTPSPLKPNEQRDDVGAYKKLTHLDDEADAGEKYGRWIGFTIRAGIENPPKLPREVREKLIDLGLSHVIMQREIRKGTFFAPYMEGGDLVEHQRKLADQKQAAHVERPDVEKVESILLSAFEPVVRNLKIMHENGIVHRDIKMDNMLLSKTRGVCLSDLDTARIIDEIGNSETEIDIPGVRNYVDSQLFEHLQARRSDEKSFIAEQKKYANVMDDYAMAMVIVQTINEHRLNKHAESETLYVFDEKAKEDIADFASKCAKQEYAEDFKELLLNPMSYLERHKGNPPHLHDMLKFD